MGVIQLSTAILLAIATFSANAAADAARVAQAVSGSIESKLFTRGFAANDPRFGSTVLRSTSVIRGITAASSIPVITAGAITAPAWMTASMVLATGAAIGYAASVGEDALTNWLLKENGTVDVNGNPMPIDPSNGMTFGSAYWSVGDGITTLYGGDGFAVARQAYYNIKARGGITNPAAPNCTQNNATQVTCGNSVAVFHSSGSINMCGKGYFFANGQCNAYNYPAPSSVPSQTGLTPQQAVNSLPAADLSKTLNPAFVAAVANAIWSKAAMEPGFDGVPFSQTRPITAQDVKAWMNANPGLAPTVADFVSPAPSTSPTAYTLPGTATAATPQPINPNASQAPVNLGPDPVVGAPNVDAPPSAQDILSPALNLMPDLRNLDLQESEAPCPKPVLHVFNSEIEFSMHCTLLEEGHIKEVIQSFMGLLWALIAALIVLSA